MLDTPSQPTGAHKYSVLEWCIDNHFELVELEVDDEEEDDEEDEG